MTQDASRETESQRAERIRRSLAIAGTPAAVTAPVTADERARLHTEAAMRLGSGAEKTPAERWLAYWGTEEANLRAQLALPPDAHYREYRARLYEALVNLGQLNEAARVAPERASELTPLRAALERPDTADCSCPDWVVAVEDPRVPGRVVYKLFPRHVAEAEIYSGHHGALVTVTRCLRCNVPNARASLPEGNQLGKRLRLAADFPASGQGHDATHLDDASDEEVVAARERGEVA